MLCKINKQIYIGDVNAESYSNVDMGITGFLNTSIDLPCTLISNHEIEVIHNGLIDGPGNPMSAYCSAILSVKTLLIRHKKIMVYGHGTSRALAVVIMYLMLARGRNSDHPTFFNYWETWDRVLRAIITDNPELTPPNEYHKLFADKLPLGALEQIIWNE